ncbi:MAG: phospho-N-acetylmuramoyl-pentapeptide-transferase [bacterium]
MLAGIPYLDFLRKKLYGQFIREDGPASHAKKSGTPTTGGIIIVIPSIIASIVTLVMNRIFNIDCVIILIPFFLYMLLGFNDDYEKITKKQNKGLSARGKLILQTAIALIPALYIALHGNTSVSIFGLTKIDLGYFYPIWAILVIIGASNAVNLTDGLDGLASGTMFFALIACTFISLLLGRNDIAIICMAVSGSCLGFLYYNLNPAKMFMGDTGSMALGGLLGTLAIIGRFELWLLIIGIIFIAETLSVIIQVISFKTTGKRVFKMSPLHHHFELSGWSEKKVVYAFWAIGFVSAVTGIILFKIFNG